MCFLYNALQETPDFTESQQGLNNTNVPPPSSKVSCYLAQIPRLSWKQCLYLCWTQCGQFSHVKVQDVELQPAGSCAAALQDLSCQQLQKPVDHTEGAQQTLIHTSSSQLGHKCDLKRLCRWSFNMYYLLSQFFLFSISNVCLNMKRTSCTEETGAWFKILLKLLTPVFSVTPGLFLWLEP